MMNSIRVIYYIHFPKEHPINDSIKTAISLLTIAVPRGAKLAHRDSCSNTSTLDSNQPDAGRAVTLDDNEPQRELEVSAHCR